MVEVSLTIGKLDASLALLLTKDHHLIEFPTILLPDAVTAGSVIKIRCERDLDLETKEKDEFTKVQDEILHTFGEVYPKPPVLKIRNVTQTSCVLEWDKLELATSSINSLSLYKDGVRLGQIPNPLQNTTTKLSGLPIDTVYKFQLKLSTSAGVFKSEEVEVKTHKMTDLSGITVCMGEIDDPKITRQMIKDSLSKMNAKPLQDKVLVDTTHFICTKNAGKEWKKAVDSNIPVVRPEWLKACELERRIIGVRMFYLNADEDVLKQRDFWGTGEVLNKPLPEEPSSAQNGNGETSADADAATPAEPAEPISEEPEPASEAPPVPAISKEESSPVPESEPISEEPAATAEEAQQAPEFDPNTETAAAAAVAEESPADAQRAPEEAPEEVVADIAATGEPVIKEELTTTDTADPVEADEVREAAVAELAVPVAAASDERVLTNSSTTAAGGDLAEDNEAAAAAAELATPIAATELSSDIAPDGIKEEVPLVVDESKLDEIPLDSRDEVNLVPNGETPPAAIAEETTIEKEEPQEEVAGEEEGEEEEEEEEEGSTPTAAIETNGAESNNGSSSSTSNKNKKKKNKNKNKKKSKQ